MNLSIRLVLRATCLVGMAIALIGCTHLETMFVVPRAGTELSDANVLAVAAEIQAFALSNDLLRDKSKLSEGVLERYVKAVPGRGVTIYCVVRKALPKVGLEIGVISSPEPQWNDEAIKLRERLAEKVRLRFGKERVVVKTLTLIDPT